MNYELLEQQIVDRIADFVPIGVQVTGFPESNAEMAKPFEGAQINVLYKGSKFGEGNRGMLRSTAQVTELETLQVDVIVRSRFLRGAEHSCYRLLKTVRRALIGFTPDNCHRMVANTNDIVFPNTEEPGDIFTYVLNFETTCLAVEEYDTALDNLANNLNTVDFDGFN